MFEHLMTTVIMLPIGGAIAQGVFSKKPYLQRYLGLGASLVSTLLLLLGMNALSDVLQPGGEGRLHESLPWVASYAINYELAMDGLNVVPLLLISMIFPVLIALEWDQRKARPGYFALLLLLQGALLGAGFAQDLFLIFFFWAMSAVPVFYLVGIWGGENRELAASRYAAFSTLGNALIFGSILLVYSSVEPHTFLIREISSTKLASAQFDLLGYTFSTSNVAFILFSLGLAMRVPVWPMHGWYTRLSYEAPATVLVAVTSGVIPIAALLLLRVSYPLFPGVLKQVAPVLFVAGAGNIILAGLLAAIQTSFRQLVAYLAMTTFGFTLFGLGAVNSAGIVGALLLQFSFGVAGGGFAIIGGLLRDRVGTDHVLTEKGEKALGGAAVKTPAIAFVSGVVVASILGIPGLGGFVSQALLWIGGYQSAPVLVILCLVSTVFGSAVLLRHYRLVFFGETSTTSSALADLSLRERLLLSPWILASFALGVYPKPLLDYVRPAVEALITQMKAIQ